jgi:glyoxylase-like metal-dependent hydrolase (beta-lactamase superfamily II)
VIASWLYGDVLIDCGPKVCLDRLTGELGGLRPRVLLLTHIHLDHAGAAGSLVRQWPDLEIHVHPVGLPHLVDPAKLIRSAKRIYGDEMDRLWGPIEPVPERNLRPIDDGGRIGDFLAVHTPGHASHHVAFFNLRGREAFPGDALGVRLGGSDLIVPHAPPPDIDVEAWDRSIDAIADWSPNTLHLPHFGVVDDVTGHLAVMRGVLHRKAELARNGDLDTFVEVGESELAALDDRELALDYLHAAPIDHSFLGLRRYWDKRES